MNRLKDWIIVSLVLVIIMLATIDLFRPRKPIPVYNEEIHARMTR